MTDLESLRPLLAPRGVLLATTNIGTIDVRNPDDVYRAQVSTAGSELEVAKMKIRMKRAGRGLAMSGAPKWRRAFGYQDGIDGPERDPVTAPLVAKAYALLIAGASIGDIVRMFNGAGAHGLNGKPWTASTVSLFLRAPRNAGLRAYGGEIVAAGQWPALVPEATWRQAQDILNAPHRKPGRKSVQRHLLTGAIHCGKCGHHLTAHITQTGAAAYNCRKCRGVSVRSEHVTPCLYGVVADRLSRPDAVDLLKADIDPAEAAELRRELGVLYARLESIGVDVGEGLLTGAQAKAATDTVNTKIAALERRQQDSERLRVFVDLPLGKAEVADAVARLPEGRFRAVLDLLATITIAPVGKGGKQFNPERVLVDWR
jgi:hypothetical protein